MPNESKTPEEHVSDALDLMVKAGWVKPHVQSVEGLGVDWTGRGKLAMEALGYMIEDLGPENLLGPICSGAESSCWKSGRLRIGSQTGSSFKQAMETA
jgi:hypothetical protein